MIKIDQDILGEIDGYVSVNKDLIKSEYNKSVDSRERNRKNNEKLEYRLNYELKIRKIYQGYLAYERSIYDCLWDIHKLNDIHDKLYLYQKLFELFNKIDELIDNFKSIKDNFYYYMNR